MARDVDRGGGAAGPGAGGAAATGARPGARARGGSAQASAHAARVGGGQGAGAAAGLLGDDVPAVSIGRVVALTGLSARQVRYFEQQGLLAAARTRGGQRLYSRDQVQVLGLIKRLRQEGYSLAQVRGMLPRPQPGGGGAVGQASAAPGAFRGEEAVSLYPMVNRGRLLEILERLERRDARPRGPRSPE